MKNISKKTYMEFELIAKTFQGLEEVLAKELTVLGANNVEIGRRMVSFTGNKEMMYRANFSLRTALRILKPIKHFKAQSAEEVYDAVKAIEWEQYLTVDKTFAVDAVVFSDEFRHSKFVAYKVKDAIVDYFREKTGDRPNVRLNNPDLALNIHVAQDKCTLSLDSSGESLHRRGYRQETMEAPLNEVLAAGMILMTGWQGECDFIDPMCGSGTLPIEAALIARNIAPGVFRKEYAFEKWNDFDQDLFDHIYNDDSAERDFDHKIYGYDNNRQAVEVATRNVRAAGLTKVVEITLRDFEDFQTPEEKAIIVSNPPYGERISSDDLLGLYAMIGNRLKNVFKEGDAWILSYREECFDKIGLKPSVKIPVFNGALACEFRKYQLFSGRYNDFRREGEELTERRERRERDEKRAGTGRYEERRQRRFEERKSVDKLTREKRDGDRARGEERRGRKFDKRDSNERPRRDDRKFDGERKFDRNRKDGGFKPRREDRGQKQERRFGTWKQTDEERELRGERKRISGIQAMSFEPKKTEE
jgi:putative N6-adenine-specific DNA methylase